MRREYTSLAFAYVGIIVGAGLSSGQDLMQYFLSFGLIGLIGVIAMGVMNAIFGKIIVTLGSHYQSDNHQEVFEKIAHPVVNRILDITLIVAGFAMAFVMVAGAGANLHQQFGIPAWGGALLCSVLVIVVAFMDFDRITRVLGIFTPIIIVMILVVTAYTFIGKSYDFGQLNLIAKTMKPAMPSVLLSAVNYYALCAMTGVSMAFVLGGSVVRIGVAEKGGLLGGSIIGVIVSCASLTLFANMDTIIGKDIPMLEIVKEIHPYFAIVYALTIFALIFNTAFSLYYATARRFAGGSMKKMRMILIVLVVVGYICSFGGFKQLVGHMYPILGYMGMLLLGVLAVAWVREKPNILKEKMLRRRMIRMVLSMIHHGDRPGGRDKKHYYELGEESVIETESIAESAYLEAKQIAAENDDLVSFAEQHLSVE